MALQSMDRRVLYGQEIRINWASLRDTRPDTSNHFHIFLGDLAAEVTSPLPGDPTHTSLDPLLLLLLPTLVSCPTPTSRRERHHDQCRHAHICGQQQPACGGVL